MKKLLLVLFSIYFNLSFSFAVYDGANHQENMLSRIESVKQTLEAVQQTKNQLEQIRNETINMASLGRELTVGQLDLLQKNIQSVINIRNKTMSEINNFKNFENDFKNLYKNFEDFDNYSFDQRLDYLNRLLGEIKNVLSDSYRILEIGDVNKLSNDSQRIQAIMGAANSAKGQKAVLQATSQFVEMQIQILGEQRTLMSGRLKAQNTMMLKQVQQEAIENINIEKLKEVDIRILIKIKKLIC